jgi:hypothetical protein
MNKLIIQGVISDKSELKSWTTQIGRQNSHIFLHIDYDNDYEDFTFKFKFKNKKSELANSFSVGSEVIIEGRLTQEFYKDEATNEIRPYMVLLGISIKLASLQGQSQMQGQPFQQATVPTNERPDLEDDFLNPKNNDDVPF